VVAPSSGVAFDTFTDFQSDDTLFFATADAFNSDAIVLGDVAVFQDYLDAATSLSVSDNDLSWFQFDGNTFVVQAVDEVANTFQNGTDISVKLTGLIDLSDAAFAGGGLTL
jgi:S-layer protein